MTDAILPAIQGDPDDANDTGRATYADVTGRGGRKPVVAQQWQRHNFRATLRQHRGHYWHKAKYHGVRSPMYAGRTGWYSARGAFRLLMRFLRWLHWIDGYELVSMAVAAGRPGHGEAMRAHTEGEKTRQRRMRLAGAYLLPAVAGLLAMVKWSPWWGWALLGLVVVRILLHHGRPQGKRITDAAVIEPKYERLTTDIIVRALGSLQLSAIDRVLREGGQIAFISPVQRDGPGWRVTFDLPYGVTSVDVIERRDKFASGLRRPAGCVWPEEEAEHPGRLTLYVCDEPMAKMKQPPWPLLKAGQANIFEPLPFGTDQRGKPQAVELIWANMLIGAISRMGKTVAMRNVLLAAALDPRVDLHVWELKGTGDLSALEKVAVAYGSGADDETIQDCLADLRKLHGELEQRAKRIKELPREMAPDSKITPQLVARKSLRLRPILVAIDECQEAFTSDYTNDFERLCLPIIRRGPALGIMLVLATQRPDAKSLPTAISSNIALRFCLKVMDQTANDMILGTSAYKRGINSALLSFSDKGVGWAVGFQDAPMILKAYNLNGPAAARICDRARSMREEAGVLHGYAAGEGTEATEPRDVLGDVLKVMPGESAHWETLADRLAVQLPERWAAVTAEAISAQCRALGVPSVQVKVGGVNRQGCRRLDAERARVS